MNNDGVEASSTLFRSASLRSNLSALTSLTGSMQNAKCRKTMQRAGQSTLRPCRARPFHEVEALPAAAFGTERFCCMIRNGLKVVLPLSRLARSIQGPADHIWYPRPTSCLFCISRTPSPSYPHPTHGNPISGHHPLTQKVLITRSVGSPYCFSKDDEGTKGLPHDRLLGGVEKAESHQGIAPFAS